MISVLSILFFLSIFTPLYATSTSPLNCEGQCNRNTTNICSASRCMPLSGLLGITETCGWNSTCNFLLAGCIPPSFPVCLVGSSGCSTACSCEGKCANAKPCDQYNCTYTGGSCQWRPVPGASPCAPHNLPNCTAANSCPQLTTFQKLVCGNPTCALVGTSCSWTCPSSQTSSPGSNLNVLCTNDVCQSQLGAPVSTPAICQIAVSNLNVSSFSSLSNILSSVQCIWTYPNQLTCINTGQKCGNGALASCVPSSDGKSCVCTCSEDNTCFSSGVCPGVCDVGLTGVCARDSKGNCTWSCTPPLCDDPCYPACQPMCPTTPLCANSRCAVSSVSVTISNFIQASVACQWRTPQNSSCVLSNICAGKCGGTVSPCDGARCTYNGSSCAWDSTMCNLDCSTQGSSCLGFAGTICPLTGSCQTTTSGCQWSCPVDACSSVAGVSLCASITQPAQPNYDCPNWQAVCLSYGNVCQWKWICPGADLVVPSAYPGIFPDSFCVNATKISNSDCSTQNYTCVRTRLSSGAVSPYYWYSFCPQRTFDIETSVTVTTNCSSASCGFSQFDLPNLSCGSNSVTAAACLRTAGGVCISASSCATTVPLPVCVTSPCKYFCYDPTWISNPSSAPDAFNASQIETSCPNYNCTTYCRSLLICGRKANDPLCRFYSESESYDTCLSKCRGTPVTTKPTCYGYNPCNCNYTACKFVSFTTYGASVGLCVPVGLDSQRVRGFAVNTTVYVTTSLPPICLVLNETVVNTTVGSIVHRFASLAVDDLQSSMVSVIDAANSTIKSFMVKYFPIINSITIPSLNGSGASTARVGVIVTLTVGLSGTDDSLTLCDIVHKTYESSSIASYSQFTLCTTTTIGNSVNGAASSKRDISQGDSSTSVIVSSDVNSGTTPPSSSNSTTPTGTPTAATPPGTPTATPPTAVSPPGTPTRSPSGSVSLGTSIALGLAVMSLLFCCAL